MLAEDAIDAIRALKADGDGQILMQGYGPLAKQLLAEGLLDELHLRVHRYWRAWARATTCCCNPASIACSSSAARDAGVGRRHHEVRQ